MARYDRLSALFWVMMAIAISEESIRLGPGSLSEPGPGLIPLGCGLVLGVFGLIVFLKSFKATTGETEALWKHGSQWLRLAFVLTSLLAYAFLIELLGFRLVTLVWMGFICRLGKIGWKATLFISVFTMLSSYILFGYYLGIRFPRGAFGW